MTKFILILSLLLFNNYLSNTNNTPSGINDYENFRLTYSSAMLGIGMGKMQPTFKVTGTHYIYTYSQNSTYGGQPRKQPDTICAGTFRKGSIDSIINLVKKFKVHDINRSDTKHFFVYEGEMQLIHVRQDSIDVKFELHNEGDPTAQKIVDVLNSNIPEGKNKLWICSGYHGK